LEFVPAGCVSRMTAEVVSRNQVMLLSDKVPG
jgi:hypothetical protein